MGLFDIFKTSRAENITNSIIRIDRKLDNAKITSENKQTKMVSSASNDAVFAIENEILDINDKYKNSEVDWKSYGKILNILKSAEESGYLNNESQSELSRVYNEHIIRYLRDVHKLPSDVWRIYQKIHFDKFAGMDRKELIDNVESIGR